MIFTILYNTQHLNKLGFKCDVSELAVVGEITVLTYYIEYCNWRVCGSGVTWRARRLAASSAVLCARAGLPPPPPPAPLPPHALSALHELVLAASTDDPMLGRVQWQCAPCEAALGAWGGAAAALGALTDADGDPPEHLHWPEPAEMEELSSTPPAPAPAPPPSLMTSAAASLATMWRVFTK
ncbi:unnamed protein product [Arctia plantaginis]|uniref:Uncharacterized protein n=1 Tax=Arctia plantaginis TaxID=874455 RepID=A0A8S1AJR4_ARCPL|nr:unnamed protein product [Arctia plantaginis]